MDRFKEALKILDYVNPMSKDEEILKDLSTRLTEKTLYFDLSDKVRSSVLSILSMVAISIEDEEIYGFLMKYSQVLCETIREILLRRLTECK